MWKQRKHTRLVNHRVVLAAGAFALTASCFSSSLALAGETIGKVNSYHTYDWPSHQPLLFVYMDSAPSNVPGCASATTSVKRWVTRTDTPGGKAHMATLMLAKAMGQTIYIRGRAGYYANPCEDWPDTESIQMIEPRN